MLRIAVVVKAVQACIEFVKFLHGGALLGQFLEGQLRPTFQIDAPSWAHHHGGSYRTGGPLGLIIPTGFTADVNAVPLISCSPGDLRADVATAA